MVVILFGLQCGNEIQANTTNPTAPQTNNKRNFIDLQLTFAQLNHW